MRSVRIVIFLSVIGLVCTPFLITRSHAERAAGKRETPLATKGMTTIAPLAQPQQRPEQLQQAVFDGPRTDAAPINPEVLERLGLGPQQPSRSQSAKTQTAQGINPESAGLPTNMNATAPFSAAVATTVAKGFQEVDVMGDWDGREDDTADHSGKIMDSSNVPSSADPKFFFTRVAISEHTMANGFFTPPGPPTPGPNEDIFYTGDSIGNVYVSSSTSLTNASPNPSVFVINIPTAIYSFGTITPGASSQFVVTGLAVNPVADLGSFSAVNGSYAADFPAGTIGEILYVAVTDIGSGFTTPPTGATVQRSAVIAFPVSDAVNAAASAPPGRISPASYPVTVGGGLGVAFSIFSNLAGCAVDDDGNLYFQQVDLSGLTGANIVKVTSLDSPANQDRSLATSGALVSSTLNPAGGNYASTGSGTQINKFTNYSGTSSFFGNVISLSTGSGNLLYAAVARSLNIPDSAADQATEGPFQNPGALGATPSMVITFADASGSFDNCSAPNPGVVPPCPGCPANTKVGIIPVGDGFADPVPGTSSNWLAFVLGNGPDRRAASGSDSIVFGTSASTLKIDMGIDHSIYSGLTVDEEGTVYVISGGSPAGVGSSPSNNRSEILNFEDNRPANRRADYIDFRGDTLPNPPNSGVNFGDGDSDRFDHLYYVAPIDVSSLTPAGLSGLARGFLRYTNRLAPNEISPGVSLGKTAGQRVQGDDDFTGAGGSSGGGAGGGGTPAPILFGALDPSGQVAGGDDQVSPFRGDDDDGAGNPPVAGPLNGGFEFLFANPLGNVFQVGAACGTGNGVWNGFFLNSNGNITFGAGDSGNIAADTTFRSGAPRIAPAWTDLNPNARATNPGDFPVQAVGFSGVNAFKVRYINVPQFADESCAANNPVGSGLTNTFSVTLYDDGTGIDENANQPLNPANPIGNNAVAFDLLEGPTDNRFLLVITGALGALVGEPPRLDGSGLLTFTYGRMDLLGDGTGSRPVLTGYSIGNQNPLNPTGLCELNLSADAAFADTGFGNIEGQTETRWPTFIGDGTEPEIHQYFHNAVRGTIDPGTGAFTLSQPDFDLRFQGNGNANPANPLPATEVNRDHVGLYGTTCLPPANPQVSAVFAGPLVTTPGTAGNSVINAYGPVTVNLFGTGFFANEATTICASPSTGDAANPDITVPIARPGKTVSSAVTVSFDTNGDSVVDTAVVLTNITPVSKNLMTATAAPLPNGSGTGVGSPWPFIAPGGVTTVTSTTTFSPGNNNIFNLLAQGGFTRTASNPLFDTGARAPVVISSSPSSGDSSSAQSLTILGYDFQYLAATTIPGTFPATLKPFNVNGVFAVQRDNPANVIQATSFNVLNNNLISAVFNFNNAPPGTQFLIFAKNAAGNSRNALTAPGGASPNGNEQGNFILFTTVDTTPPTITCPANVTVNGGAGQSSATVTYSAPTASDNLGGPVTVTCDHPSGSSFNVGTTLVTCTATDQSGNPASCSFNVTVVGSNSMHFSAATATLAEGCDATTVTIQRDNSSGSASVDVNTSDGTATQKSDYEIASATLNFAPGETSKLLTLLANEDTYLEGPETFNVTLSNPQGGFVGNGPITSTVTITDNDVLPPTSNSIDVVPTFVCEHYHDFLNREPDAPGAAFWTAQITACGANPACIEAQRVNVSASFFLSIEFQESGGDVLRIQRAAFAKRSNSSVLRVPYLQYMHDAQQVGRGVIIGQAGAQALLDANKAAYATQIVSSSAFITLYPTSQTAAQFVTALFASAGVTPTTAETNAAIAAFGAGDTAGRAAALQSVADSNSVRNAEFNAAFVLMEYYGFLRRNPTDAPDNNDNGYQFWLTKLNTFNGNFINAEMVKAFLNSSEYRQRFGP